MTPAVHHDMIPDMAYTDPDHEQELIEWERYMRETGREYEGDPRRCPRHPSMVTSSPDGLFDAPCPACEMEMDTGEPYEDVPAAPQPRPITERPTQLCEINDDDIPF